MTLRPSPPHLLALTAASLLCAAAVGQRLLHHTTTPAKQPLVVAYFGQWGVYDHFFVKNLVTSGAIHQIDQINYAQGFVTNGHCSIADPKADLNMTFSAADSVTGRDDDPNQPFRGNLHQLAELKRRNPRLKVLISLEGQAKDFAADAQPAAREAFVRSCVDIFLHGHLAPGVEAPHLFDGIDVDWEYPHGDDGPNFLALLQSLRREMDAVRPGLRLTIAAGPSPRMYGGVDLPAINQLLDQVGLMNYDYNGPWNARTGFLAPLYTEEGKGGSVERSINEWQTAGIPASKLLLGLPFYGYGWQEVARTDNGLLQTGHSIRGDRPYPFFRDLMAAPSQRPGSDPLPAAALQAMETSAAPGGPAAEAAPAKALPQKSIATAQNTPPAPFVLYRDPRSKAPWLFDGSTFWTYEDPTSVRTKARFARDQHLGGVMAWELSEDAEDGALIHAAHQGLLGPAR